MISYATAKWPFIQVWLKNNSGQGLGISIYNTGHNILALFINLAQV